MKNLNLIILLFSFINCGSVETRFEIETNQHFEINDLTTSTFNFGEINKPNIFNVISWIELSRGFWEEYLDPECIDVSIRKMDVYFDDISNFCLSKGHCNVDGYYKFSSKEKRGKIKISNKDSEIFTKNIFIHELGHHVLTFCSPVSNSSYGKKQHEYFEKVGLDTIMEDLLISSFESNDDSSIYNRDF